MTFFESLTVQSADSVDVTAASLLAVSSEVSPPKASVDVANTTYLTSAEASSECIRLPNASFLSQVNVDSALVSHATEKIVYGVFQLGASMVLCVAGVPGNFVNLIVFRRMGLKDRVNLCLFWLSFCDMMSLAAHVLRSGELAVQFYSGAGGRALRMMRSDMALVLYDYGLGTVSGFRQIAFFMYALIALDRCLCVLMPLRIRQVLSDTSIKLVIVAGSLLSFALSAFNILSHGTLCVVILDTGFRGYTIGPSRLMRSHPGFQRFSLALDSFVLGLALPVLFLGTVVVSTAITVVTLRRREGWLRQVTFSSSADTSTAYPEGSQPQSGAGRGHTGSGGGQEAAVTKMLVMVSAVYVLCTLPIFLHRLVRFFLPGFAMRGTFGNLFMVTYYVNSFLANVNAAVNFLVFYRQGTRFRRQVHALFRTCCSCSAARELRHANGEGHHRPDVTEVFTFRGNNTRTGKQFTEKTEDE